MRQSKKEWSTRWNGHTIVVGIWVDWKSGRGENVFVDGDLVCEQSGEWNATSTLLEAEIHDANGSYPLRVEIGASATNRFVVICHIFINGELVGGDTEKKLLALAELRKPVSLSQQRKELRRALFFQGFVAPVILIPLLFAIEDYFYSDQNFSLVLVYCMWTLVHLMEIAYKFWKLARDNPADKPKNSTSV